MGAGKTSVGRACARRLDRAFVDIDEVIELGSRRTISEIFASDGEVAFRLLERDALAEACALPEPGVIACGGGAVVDPDNRRALRASCCVIWLRVPTTTLALRVGTGSGRPLLAGGETIETRLDRLGELRAPAYEAAAHAVLDTDGCSVDEASLGVLDAFTRCRP